MLTCTEADRIRREGPSLTVERMDGVARVSYQAILSEQQEARAALAEANAGPRPLTLHQHGLAMWLADLVAEEILSFGEAGPQAPETLPQVPEAAAARAPNYVDERPVRPHTELDGAGL